MIRTASLRIFAFSFVAIASFAAAYGAGLSDTQNPRETLSLDQGWKFHLGDIPKTAFAATQDITSGDSKAGQTWGAASPKFDDKDWRVLDLPHDWVVEGPFDERENFNQGFRPRGIAWYRREFKLPDSDRGRQIELQFDGVATHCTVWVNGILAARNWCGYTSFYTDITPFVKYGSDVNTIAVRVDADDMEGWWYEGGGIYRHTWLVKKSPVHLITDGVYANPVKAPNGQWMLPVEATLENTGQIPASVMVDVGLFDAAGRKIAGGRAPAKIDVLDKSIVKLAIPVASPKLWSVDQPNLYEVRTAVYSDDKLVDAVTTTCGFRTIRFDKDKGFFLNDQPLKLHGSSNHQDHAGVGIAVPDSLWDFRIRKLKEMGDNAYRCAHNPPAKEFLDACDRLGMLVMDENRHFNTSPEYMRQLEWMVRRDRNHPSVILWSIFNEENAVEGTEQGEEMARRMVAAVKRLDTTRPVTAAQNQGQLIGDKANPHNTAQVLDVVGINYQMTSYDKIRKAYPDKPMTSSEDTAQVQVRGEYKTDKSRFVVESYDDESLGWNNRHRDSWKAIASQPSFAGCFFWTGLDYHGEPAPYKWPQMCSSFGAMDLCGFPKMAFYLRQALWVHDRPVLHLVPHWNWPGEEGKPIKVMALTNADTVALSLNGKLIGEKPVDKFYMVSWEVPYAPGKLEAVARKDGKEVARCTVETTDAPVALRLVPDRTAIAGDGRDAVPVAVEAIDDKGRLVPTANLPVEFEISGPGAIIGLGNGDPNCHEPEKGDRRSLFNGLAEVIVQSRQNGSGNLVLRAKAKGLQTAETVIDVKAAPALPAVPVL